ncbi:MAG TPA: redoxin domain-containing protein [Gemmatimonadaceae bacterium]|nr:redoxin domain-containing protein [Gemmatimonadaceae bacterium]
MNWRRSTIAVAAAVPFIALLGFGLRHDPREIPSPLPGREAPGFALAVFSVAPNADAPPAPDTVRLAALRGDVVVLNFWASWCLACRDEHGPLAQTAASYANRPDVHFYGVLYQDSPENGREWLRRMGVPDYPALEDPRSRAAIDYGLYGVPETFFIGRDGRVAYKHVGPVTERLLASKIDSLLAAPRPVSN